MRKKVPDNRLNWRDPDMPVLRIAKPDNNPNAPWGVYEFPADMIHNYHKHAMNSPRVEPTWRYDPSYWWADNKKKKDLK